MFPPTGCLFRQSFASDPSQAKKTFAPRWSDGHGSRRAAWLAEPAAHCPDGNPYPSFRPCGRAGFFPFHDARRSGPRRWARFRRSAWQRAGGGWILLYWCKGCDIMRRN